MAKTIQKQQKVLGITTKMSRTVVEITTETIQLKIQNRLITKQVLQEN